MTKTRGAFVGRSRRINQSLRSLARRHMQKIGISPTVDFAFKLMLGSPEHTRVTVHFLNALLGSELGITRVEFHNPFVGKNYEDDKLVVLDILAIDDHGRRLNIEMQTSLPAGISQRLVGDKTRRFHSRCEHRHYCQWQASSAGRSQCQYASSRSFRA